jgi:acyl carrier protein
LPDPDITGRLEKCFEAIFPDMTPEQIRAANSEQVTQWDSMATVTLLAVVNEEFSSDLDLDQMEPLGSFTAMRQYLESHPSNG